MVVACVACSSGDRGSTTPSPDRSTSSASAPVDGSTSLPSAADGTCSAATADPPSLDATSRLQLHVERTGELLRENGVAPGPYSANGELSIDQAFDRASAYPGDAAVAVVSWLIQANADGLYGNATHDDQARVAHIESFTVTDEVLARQFGANWREVLDVVEHFASPGFDSYIDDVRTAPPMRAANALTIRSQLQRHAEAQGHGAQWKNTQDIVVNYFQVCNMAALGRWDRNASFDALYEGRVLGEALAHDAVAAAFVGDDAYPVSATPLAKGLQIALDPETYTGDAALTRDFDPNENLDPEDRELLEAEEPVIEGP